MRFRIKEDKLLLDNNIIGYEDSERYYYHHKGDISIEMFFDIRNEDIIDNITFFGRTSESEFIDIKKENGIVYFSFAFDIDIFNWKENISISEYKKKMIENLNLCNDYKINATYVHDEDSYVCIFVEVELPHDECFEDVYININEIYLLNKEIVLNENIISNTISFSSEHLTAGSSILQYFGKLLQEKYPNEKVSVSIKQEGLKVTMFIETPDGKKEEIEEYLNRYGMVVTNQITPQEFTSNPIQVLELETKLNQAEQEIRFQKKLIALQDKTYDENLVSLKDEVNYLRSELSALRVSNNENIHLLLISLLKKDKLINKLTKSIEKRDDKETKHLLLELKEKDTQGYISLKQHIDNAIIGGLVNAPSWIQFTMEVLKRL